MACRPEHVHEREITEVEDDRTACMHDGIKLALEARCRRGVELADEEEPIDPVTPRASDGEGGLDARFGCRTLPPRAGRVVVRAGTCSDRELGFAWAEPLAGYCSPNLSTE